MITKEKIKSIIIFGLIIIIAIFTQYSMQTNNIIKTTAKHTLYNFRNEIISLDYELSKQNNISLDELKDILKESSKSGILDYSASTYSYSQLKRLEYIDISYFYQYMGFLIGGELPEEEAEFHENNLKKICELWWNFNDGDNLFYPSTELKNICEKTNEYSSNGIDRINEFRIKK
ncbi:hypothetical protein [Aminipila sp.]|uniref:hypothetical protein n=1 Tax=Aminipila sp. TaxID=2060095 RepID=UPI00289F6730|nr:hypothetical protein [Aminipila sp.]